MLQIAEKDDGRSHPQTMAFPCTQKSLITLNGFLITLGKLVFVENNLIILLIIILA